MWVHQPEDVTPRHRQSARLSPHFTHGVPCSTPGKVPEEQGDCHRVPTPKAEGETWPPGMPPANLRWALVRGQRDQGLSFSQLAALGKGGDTGPQFTFYEDCGGRQPKTAALCHHLCAIMWKALTKVGFKGSPCRLSSETLHSLPPFC